MLKFLQFLIEIGRLLKSLDALSWIARVASAKGMESVQYFPKVRSGLGPPVSGGSYQNYKFLRVAFERSRHVRK